MKKIFSLILISLSFFAYAQNMQGAENAENAEAQGAGNADTKEAQGSVANKFDISALLMSSEIDGIFRMPQSSHYVINANKVFKGENFRYLPLIYGAVKENGAPYKLECTIYLSHLGIKDRVSLRKVLMDKYLIEGTLANASSTLFFPEDMYLTFSDTDEFGMHKVEFEVKNLLTGEVAICESLVDLIAWENPQLEMSQEDINHFLFHFNSNFDFVGFYAAMTSQHLNLYKKGGFKGFDTITMFFAKHLFAKHKFLLEKFYENFPTMDSAARRNLIMINAFIGNEAFKDEELDSQEIILQNYMLNEFDFSLNPYESELLSDFELEALWGEFFALGSYAPVEKILKSIGTKQDVAYAESVFDKKIPEPKTQEERASLHKGRLYLILHNYLNSYVKNPVLYRFLMWAIENSKDEDLNELLHSVLMQAPQTQAAIQAAQEQAEK